MNIYLNFFHRLELELSTKVLKSIDYASEKENRVPFRAIS